MALSLVVAHYPTVDLEEIITGFPKYDEEGKDLDVGSIWKSTRGFEGPIAGMADLKKIHVFHELPEDVRQRIAAKAAEEDVEDSDAEAANDPEDTPEE